MQKKRSFWDFFKLTEDGKLKNAFLLYAFCLGLLFLAVFLILGAAFASVSGTLAGRLPPALHGLLPVFPGLAAVGTALLCQKASRDKKLAFCAHLFLIVFFLAGFLPMAISLGIKEIGTVFQVFFPVILPLALGTLLTGLTAKKHHTNK